VRGQRSDIVLTTTDGSRPRLEVEEYGWVEIMVVAIAYVEVAARARGVALLEAEVARETGFCT
jgi:hypothetical protein